MRHITPVYALGLAILMTLVIVFGLIANSNQSLLAQSGGTLGYNSRVYGTVSAAVPVVTYDFTGSTSDFVTVRVDSWAGSLDIHLDLVAPNGVILDSSTQNTATTETNGAYLSVFLPDSGGYVLRISGENGTTGDFLLTLFGRNAANTIALVYGQPFDVTIPMNGQSQYFSYETEACPTTLIIADLRQGVTPIFPFVVKVRDQRGHTVALLRGGDQEEDWLTVVPLSGRYEVEVSADDSTAAGLLRLLVTCAADNPGCREGVAGLSCPVTCPSCPSRDDWVTGGGCPDLHLTAEQNPLDPSVVTVTWDAVSGVDGYAVYVTGLISGGGETYLTHTEWNPGDPLTLTWTLPLEGYSGYVFTLHVMIGDELLCTQQTQVDLRRSELDCPTLGLAAIVTDESVNQVTLSWIGGADVDQYDLDLYSIQAGEETYSGRLELSGNSTTYTLDHAPPALSGMRFVLWRWQAGHLCSDEFTVMFGETQVASPCAIRADREGVAVRVGPGFPRAMFAYLNPGIEYRVVGQAVDADGNLWWALDITQFTGHEGVISLWVAQSDVTPLGNCDQVPQAEIPPVIPVPDDGEPGQWLPCGSCDTCGHPASECVTSPQGVCLWDPTTCTSQQPQNPNGGVCYSVTAAIDMGQCYGGGAAVIDTAPNCQGTAYTLGTLIQAHATANDSKCIVHSWSGCGASGSGASIVFTPSGSCTITAHMGF